MNDDSILQDCHVAADVAVLRFADGETLEIAATSLPPDLPAVGRPVGPELLERLREAAERKRIARRVFALLDRRLYPLAALRAKLDEYGFDPGRSDEVLAEFSARGLHSDLHFAEAFCRDTLSRKPVGRHYLLARLRRHRVPESVAREAVDAVLDDRRQESLARRAAEVRWRRGGTASGRRGLAAVVRFLHGRGFPVGLSRRVAGEMEPVVGNEPEEEGG